MLVIIKPNKLLIWLDSHDLNKAIRREHYQISIVEEVATHISQGKKFTVEDAKNFKKCRLWNFEPCESETAKVKCEIHRSSHFSGANADPDKIQAILQVSEPEVVTTLKRLLWMVTYLAKFMLHLLQMTAT